jgi:hypothetical protein
MDQAQVYADTHCSQDIVVGPDATLGDRQWAEKWNRIRKFRVFEPEGPKQWNRCAKCVLTRWQYMGEASKYCFEYYLILFRFTQLVINAYEA